MSFLKGEKYVLSPKLHGTNLLCGHFVWQFCYATTFFRQACWGIWNSSMKNLLDRSMHYRFAPGFDFEFLSLTSRMNLFALDIQPPRLQLLQQTHISSKFVHMRKWVKWVFIHGWFWIGGGGLGILLLWYHLFEKSSTHLRDLISTK
jgi:hypothetical protein